MDAKIIFQDIACADNVLCGREFQKDNWKSGSSNVEASIAPHGIEDGVKVLRVIRLPLQFIILKWNGQRSICVAVIVSAPRPHRFLRILH
jgi:hypothetical protein